MSNDDGMTWLAIRAKDIVFAILAGGLAQWFVDHWLST